MDSFEGSPVLVTGGAGAIGGNLVRHLLRAGAGHVVILDDLSSAARWNVPAGERVTLVEGSILDGEALDAAFACRPRYVFHLAALFANQKSIEQPEEDLLTNGMGILRVLRHAQRHGVRRVVYTSSGGSVYNHSAALPFVEEDVAIELETPYQITKLLGEMYCHFFSRYHELDTVRIRLFNSYGPGELPGRFRNVIPNFIHQALLGLPLPLTGTGEETRDFTYVEDVARALAAACLCDAAGNRVFNVSHGREVAIREIALLVNEPTGNPGGIEHREPRRWDPKRRSLASSDKARQCFGFRAETELRDGLARTVAWFRENWPSIQKDARF